MNESHAAELYIELLKKTLNFTLWDEEDVDPAMKEIGKVDWPTLAHSMIGMKRMDNIQFCVESVLREGIEGDLMETGVWRGGAVIFMRALLEVHGDRERKVIAADSFEGLPQPDLASYPQDRGLDFFLCDELSVPLEEVRGNFAKYGLLDDRVVFLKGWFKDTLPDAPVEKIAVLRLDGDLYQSTMEALTNLYDKLSPGGYCIIDDFAIPACKKAVEEFRNQRGITEPLVEVDWTAVYWRRQ